VRKGSVKIIDGLRCRLCEGLAVGKALDSQAPEAGCALALDNGLGPAAILERTRKRGHKNIGRGEQFGEHPTKLRPSYFCGLFSAPYRFNDFTPNQTDVP
jgi:hypothetical protein